jgi:hypothetical protein
LTPLPRARTRAALAVDQRQVVDPPPVHPRLERPIVIRRGDLHRPGQMRGREHLLPLTDRVIRIILTARGPELAVPRHHRYLLFDLTVEQLPPRL